MISLHGSQAELFDRPTEPPELSEWKTFPGGLPYRTIDKKTTLVDFDGKPIAVTRGSGDRYSAPEILGDKRPRGFRNFMSRAVLVRDARREMALAREAMARSDAAIERVFSEVESEEQPDKPRRGNKRAKKPSDFTELHFFNPKRLISDLLFAPVPSWLKAIEGITPAEQLVYGAMIFRADDDGIFRRSILGLGNLIVVSRRALQDAVDSMENRRLILKITDNASKRLPNHYKFVWDRRFDNQTSAQSALDLTDPSSAPSAPTLAQRMRQTSAVSAHHNNKNKEPSMHEHDHVHALTEQPKELTAEQKDLLDQIEKLTASENRIAHFCTTWTKRVREYPIQVFSAIGETRNAVRENRIRKSIGGTLNWHFENFREGARKRQKPGRAV